MSEEEIIEKLLEDDEEFQKIFAEHRELDDVVASLEEKEALSEEDEVEIKRLKKIKLSLKDRMEAKIRGTK